MLGGGIKGQRIVGEQVGVDERHLFQNRDYPVLTDYRSLLGGLFQRMYGLDQNGLLTSSRVMSCDAHGVELEHGRPINPIMHCVVPVVSAHEDS